MKIFIISLWISFVTLTNGRAQDCLGVTFKSGMNYELSTFNAKDKPTGKIVYQVKDVRREGPATVMDITAPRAKTPSPPRPGRMIRIK